MSCVPAPLAEGADGYPAAEGERFGFVSRSMSWVVKPRFEAVGQYHDGLAVAECGAGRAGLINAAGDFVSRDDYRAAQRLSDGRAAVESSDGWGFVDRTGRVVVEPRYAEVGVFQEGLAVVSDVSHVNAASWLNEYGFGYIGKSGRPAFTGRFQLATTFSEGYAVVRRNGRWGWIDVHGDWAIPNIYDDGTPFHLGKAYARLGERGVLIDKRGDVVREFLEGDDFRWGPFSDGLRPVSRAGRYGYTDTTNAIRIPAVFGYALPFTGGRAAVRSRRKWGIIDVGGAFVAAPEYNWLVPIGDLFYFVRDRTNGYLDGQGHTLWSAPLGINVVYRMQPFSRE